MNQLLIYSSSEALLGDLVFTLEREYEIFSTDSVEYLQQVMVAGEPVALIVDLDSFGEIGPDVMEQLQLYGKLTGLIVLASERRKIELDGICAESGAELPGAVLILKPFSRDILLSAIDGITGGSVKEA